MASPRCQSRGGLGGGVSYNKACALEATPSGAEARTTLSVGNLTEVTAMWGSAVSGHPGPSVPPQPPLPPQVPLNTPPGGDRHRGVWSSELYVSKASHHFPSVPQTTTHPAPTPTALGGGVPGQLQPGPVWASHHPFLLCHHWLLSPLGPAQRLQRPHEKASGWKRGWGSSCVQMGACVGAHVRKSECAFVLVTVWLRLCMSGPQCGCVRACT